MTAPLKSEPTRPGAGSAKTDEDFPKHNPKSSILSPAHEYLEKRTAFSNAKNRADEMEEKFAEKQKGAEPLPLQRKILPPEPFPIEALGSLMGRAARKVMQASKVADSICGGAFLSTASLCVQGHRNVVIDGRVHPLSEFFLTVATSGDRKSTADKQALKAIHAYQREVLESEFKTEMDRYKNEYEAWLAKRKKLLRICPDDVNQQLAVFPEPKRPLEPIIICDEPTIEGLQRLYYLGPPSLGLFSDEGARFIGGYSMNKENLLKTIAILSKLWDGDVITRIRSEERYRLSGRRLASHLMLQPVIFNKMLSNPEMREQGIMARFLTAFPPAAGDTGTYNEADLNQDEHLLLFWNRCSEILDAEGGFPLKNGTDNELDPQPIKLSWEAKEIWKRFYEFVESELGLSGWYKPCYSFAKKIAEHAARIAGILETFQDLQALEISVETMRSAIAIAQWYLNEALRINGIASIDQELELAERVLEFLQKKKLKQFNVREIMRNGPNAVRTKKEAERMIQILFQHEYVKPLIEKKNWWECVF